MKRIFALLLSLLLAIGLVACDKKVDVSDYKDQIDYVNVIVEEAPMSPLQVENALRAIGVDEEGIDIVLENCGINWNAQALRAAQEVLDAKPMSKNGLIQELEGWGFAAEQVQYAANTIDVNWQDQCLYCAMLYIEQGMTKEEVHDQLIADQFTEAEWNYVLSQHYTLLENY